MEPHAIQLVTQYDGERFAGWQRQPDLRTVQGEMERVLKRLCGQEIVVLGAGRTDAGVHAHGQAAGVLVPDHWKPAALQRAMNSLLPRDIWVREAHLMTANFHARFSAIGRRYRYLVGVDPSVRSPFRNRFEWAVYQPLDPQVLHDEAAALLGDHVFRAFAVTRTAPARDHHRCVITRATWEAREGGWVFEIAANRFLHHMVRFLVGTMIEVARGRRPRGTVARLLTLSHNQETPPPAPACGLSLHEVMYPSTLYADPS
jgi:tRNA pseudouridine38-40 synthase